MVRRVGGGGMIIWGTAIIRGNTVLDFQKKILGPAGPQVFIFCRQNKYSGRQKLYLRINGSIFVTDNGLSLVYIFPKKKVTYLGGQVGEQAWKFGRHWVKAGRIGDPTGRNVEPWNMVLAWMVSQKLGYKLNWLERDLKSYLWQLANVILYHVTKLHLYLCTVFCSP